MAEARPLWVETMMRIAEEMARRSTCPRLSTGAVIATREHQILTTGYNGAPRGLPHCTDVGCTVIEDHCVRAVHAEQNAVYQAARIGVSLEGAELVCTHLPCPHCLKAAIQAGVRSIVWQEDYGTQENQEFFWATFTELNRDSTRIGLKAGRLNDAQFWEEHDRKAKAEVARWMRVMEAKPDAP